MSPSDSPKAFGGSQVPDSSLCTCRPLAPRTALCVRLLVASTQVTGFTTFGRLADCHFDLRGRIGFAYRCDPRTRCTIASMQPLLTALDWQLTVERAIYSPATFRPVNEPSLPWRTETSEIGVAQVSALKCRNTLHCPTCIAICGKNNYRSPANARVSRVQEGRVISSSWISTL